MGPRPSLIVISEETRGARAPGRGAQGMRERRYASHRTDPLGPDEFCLKRFYIGVFLLRVSVVFGTVV